MDEINVEQANKYIADGQFGKGSILTKVEAFLEFALSEEIRIHGGLLEVFGMGILIIGKSSIGKSETALVKDGEGSHATTLKVQFT